MAVLAWCYLDFSGALHPLPARLVFANAIGLYVGLLTQ